MTTEVCEPPFWASHVKTEEVGLCSVKPPTWGFSSYVVKFSATGPYYIEDPLGSEPVVHWGVSPQTEYGIPPGSTHTNNVVSALGLRPNPEVPYDEVPLEGNVPVYNPFPLPW